MKRAHDARGQTSPSTRVRFEPLGPEITGVVSVVPETEALPPIPVATTPTAVPVVTAPPLAATPRYAQGVYFPGAVTGAAHLAPSAGAGHRRMPHLRSITAPQSIEELRHMASIHARERAAARPRIGLGDSSSDTLAKTIQQLSNEIIEIRRNIKELSGKARFLVNSTREIFSSYQDQIEKAVDKGAVAIFTVHVLLEKNEALEPILLKISEKQKLLLEKVKQLSDLLFFHFKKLAEFRESHELLKSELAELKKRLNSSEFNHDATKERLAEERRQKEVLADRLKTLQAQKERILFLQSQGRGTPSIERDPPRRSPGVNIKKTIKENKQLKGRVKGLEVDVAALTGENARLKAELEALKKSQEESLLDFNSFAL